MKADCIVFDEIQKMSFSSKWNKEMDILFLKNAIQTAEFELKFSKDRFSVMLALSKINRLKKQLNNLEKGVN